MSESKIYGWLYYRIKDVIVYLKGIKVEQRVGGCDYRMGAAFYEFGGLISKGHINFLSLPVLLRFIKVVPNTNGCTLKLNIYDILYKIF